MKISIKGLDDSYKLGIENISQLFFEETEIFYNIDQEAELSVDLFVRGDQHVETTAHLTIAETGKSYDATYQIDIHAENEREWRKQVKHAVNYVYLTVLQDFTGISQPWGTLTGIRPTKLLHKLLQNGLTKEQAHQRLKNDYQLNEEKITLMQEIIDKQLAAIPDLYELENEISIYIGIPFCPTKCAYCTFPAYAINGKNGSVPSFLSGLHYEIQETGRFLRDNNIKVTTIYFGGGTPTSITAAEMDSLYSTLFDSIPHINKVREITVEAGRPDTITPEKLEVLNKWNIDRISINPQSYIQETLKAIGRHHTVEETIEKFYLAREMSMNNINMDLIIGLPGEGLSEFQHTLNETKKLMPESLTVHTLAFKRASQMTKNKEKYKVADRDEIKIMMDEAGNWMAENNYTPYYLYRQKNILGNLENVGYSLKGQESIYNIMIMEEKQTILGLGCGASSKFIHPKTGKITRFANPKEPNAYNLGYIKYTQDKINIIKELFN